MDNSKSRDINMFLLGVVSSFIASFIFFHLMKSRSSTQSINFMDSNKYTERTITEFNKQKL